MYRYLHVPKKETKHINDIDTTDFMFGSFIHLFPVRLYEYVFKKIIRLYKRTKNKNVLRPQSVRTDKCLQQTVQCTVYSYYSCSDSHAHAPL